MDEDARTAVGDFFATKRPLWNKKAYRDTEAQLMTLLTGLYTRRDESHEQVRGEGYELGGGATADTPQATQSPTQANSSPVTPTQQGARTVSSAAQPKVSTLQNQEAIELVPLSSIIPLEESYLEFDFKKKLPKKENVILPRVRAQLDQGRLLDETIMQCLNDIIGFVRKRSDRSLTPHYPSDLCSLLCATLCQVLWKINENTAENNDSLELGLSRIVSVRHFVVSVMGLPIPNERRDSLDSIYTTLYRIHRHTLDCQDAIENQQWLNSLSATEYFRDLRKQSRALLNNIFIVMQCIPSNQAYLRSVSIKSLRNAIKDREVEKFKAETRLGHLLSRFVDLPVIVALYDVKTKTSQIASQDSFSKALLSGKEKEPEIISSSLWLKGEAFALFGDNKKIKESGIEKDLEAICAPYLVRILSYAETIAKSTSIIQRIQYGIGADLGNFGIYLLRGQKVRRFLEQYQQTVESTVREVKGMVDALNAKLAAELETRLPPWHLNVVHMTDRYQEILQQVTKSLMKPLSGVLLKIYTINPSSFIQQVAAELATLDSMIDMVCGPGPEAESALPFPQYRAARIKSHTPNVAAAMRDATSSSFLDDDDDDAPTPTPVPDLPVSQQSLNEALNEALSEAEVATIRGTITKALAFILGHSALNKELKEDYMRAMLEPSRHLQELDEPAHEAAKRHVDRVRGAFIRLQAMPHVTHEMHQKVEQGLQSIRSVSP